MATCAQHYAPIHPELGYCWKCLAEERDRPHDPGPSWWWASESQVFCQCRDPVVSPDYNYCVKCGRLAKETLTWGQAA